MLSKNARLTTSLVHVILCGALVIVLSPIAPCQSPFHLTKISGTTPFSSVGINNQGQVVGAVATDSDPSQVFLWTRTAGVQVVTVDKNSFATGINHAGQIVGASGDTFKPQAFVWNSDTGTQHVQTLGADESIATSINHSGTVVGYSYFSQIGKAFIWTKDSGMQNLLPQVTQGNFAQDINDSGQVVGFYTPNGSSNAHSFLWSENVGIQDLGTLGGPTSFGYAINNAGTVVGSSSLSSGNNAHAFSWTSTGGMQDLGTLNSSLSQAYGINNRGWIVGTSNVHNPVLGPVGFLWTAGSGILDLRKGLMDLRDARIGSAKVNDFGVIVLGGDTAIYILSPVMKISVTSTPNPSLAGQPVTFTATVGSIAGPPPDGEIVQFKLGTKILGTAPLNNGVAHFTTSALNAGIRKIMVKYVGDANYEGAKGSVQQVVNP